MASVHFFLIENNIPDPFLDAPLLHLLLRGIKYSVGLSSKRRLPITMSLLRKLKTELAQAPGILPRDKLILWSAFTVAFFAFLRSSEFTSPSTSHFNALSHLSGNDISFNSDGSLSLHLKSSKTDPYRQGCSLLIAPSGHSVCTVCAIKKYMAHHPFNSDGPFYTFQSGLYLTRAQVTSTLRLLLKRLHIPTELYASHSFRIRAATTPAEAGLPLRFIQALGRWSSNCFALYIQIPSSILQKVPGLLANAAAGTQSIWNPQEGRCTHLT